MSEKYTKDSLIKIILDNQGKTIEVMSGVKTALEAINDQNKLHFKKEDERYDMIKNLAVTHDKFYSYINRIVLLIILALIILAGAEKLLKFL